MKLCSIVFTVIFIFCVANTVFALPNPAAVYCRKLGYEYKIVKDADGGERGVCVVSPGVEFDAWEFFRGEVGKEYSYCAQCGYDTETETIDKGTYTIKRAVCVSKRSSSGGGEAPSGGEVRIPLLELMEQNGEPLIEEEQYRMPEVPKENGEAREPLSIPPVSSTPPSSFDWRDYNGESWMTPVKDQGDCGSCWAFASLGVTEAKVNIDNNNPDLDCDLSEQQFVSCSGAGDCSGGDMIEPLEYLRNTGITYETCFPYTAVDAWGCCCWGAGSPFCHPPTRCSYICDSWQDEVVQITNHHHVTPNTQEEYKQALIDFGPLHIATSSTGWDYYTGGIFVISPGSGAGHAVVLVGWNDAEGYWIIKNSYGAGWGENGYIRLSYIDDPITKFDWVYAIEGTIIPDVSDSLNFPSSLTL